jgi:hypothetical protein
MAEVANRSARAPALGSRVVELTGCVAKPANHLKADYFPTLLVVVLAVEMGLKTQTVGLSNSDWAIRRGRFRKKERYQFRP